MRLKLVLALLALGMIPVTFTSCGDVLVAMIHRTKVLN